MPNKSTKVILPEGFDVVREEDKSTLRWAINFHITGMDEGEPYDVTTVTVRYSRREGWWSIQPGSTTNGIEPNEARARAYALALAARECDERNNQGDKL